MFDHHAILRSQGLVDLSARPDSPVRPVRRVRAGSPRPTARRARSGLARALHRLATVLEPRPSTERNRATATPACQ